MKLLIPLWARVIPVYIAIAGIIFMPVATKSIRVDRVKTEAVLIERSISKGPTDSQVSGYPKQILLPSVGINLLVIDGDYSTSKGWSVSANAANYATITPKLNNKNGNTVIYGHDTSRIFKPTENLKVGDKVYIHTDTSKIFSYSYTGDSNVAPSDTTIFKDPEIGKPRLTLITCSGSLSQTRRIMNFSFQGFSK